MARSDDIVCRLDVLVAAVAVIGERLDRIEALLEADAGDRAIPEYLDAKGASLEVGYSDDTIRRWCARHPGLGHQVSDRLWIVDMVALRRFVATRPKRRKPQDAGDAPHDIADAPR
jgi:hypothetical protein